MPARLKGLLPWLVCCAPGLLLAAGAGLAFLAGGTLLGLRPGSASFLLLVAAALACPLGKLAILWTKRGQVCLWQPSDGAVTEALWHRPRTQEG